MENQSIQQADGGPDAHHYYGNPLRFVRQEGALWFFCRDVCRLLKIPRGALQRLDRRFTVFCLNDSGRRTLAVNLQGVLALVALAGLHHEEALSVYIQAVKEDGTPEPLGGMDRTDLAAVNGLAVVIRCLQQYAPSMKPAPGLPLESHPGISNKNFREAI
jgi:hypothetical protein